MHRCPPCFTDLRRRVEPLPIAAEESERDIWRGIALASDAPSPLEAPVMVTTPKGARIPEFLEPAMSRSRHDQDDGADFAKSLADLTKVSPQRRTNNP